MIKEYVTTINIFWTGSEESTMKDAEEAIVRSNLKRGELLGEWLIESIEPVEEY